MKFYDALLPYNQNDQIEIRQAEPYSYCQFIIGRDHSAYGRARHPWLTGSAAGLIPATQWILGIRLAFDGLIIDPCIPADWPGFEVTRGGEERSTTLSSEIHGVEKGIRTMTLNGELDRRQHPAAETGTSHTIIVTMGLND